MCVDKFAYAIPSLVSWLANLVNSRLIRLSLFAVLSGAFLSAQAPSGWLNIVSDSDGQCIDMKGGPSATSAGVDAQQWTCLGTTQTNQIFEFVPVTGGYKLVPNNSGLALQPVSGSTANGTDIVQEPYTGAAYQIWNVQASPVSGYYTIRPNSATGSCLTIASGSTSTGALIRERACGAYTYQYWKFAPITPANSTTVTLASVSPTSGPTAGGTAITLTGTNFASGSTVTVGGVAATNVLVSSSTNITANTPAGTAGPVAAKVTSNSQTASMSNAFTYVSPQPSITYVQGNYATPQASETSVAIPFTNAQQAGDLNVVVVGWNDSTAAVQSIADTMGNVYTNAVGPTALAGAASQSIYYAKNILAAAAGTNTVTVMFSPAAAYPDIRVLEYAGADYTSPLDVVAAATGNSATSATPAITTNFSSELLVGANLVLTTTNGPGTGFTERMLTSPDGDIAEDAWEANVGSYSASAPLSSAGAWVMQMVTFKTNSGTPPPPTYGISGTVSGGPATLALSGTSSATTATSSSGTYTFSGLSDGTYIVTPSESGYTFTPASASVTVTNGSVTGVNFTATSNTAPPHSVTLTWVASTSTSVVSYNVYRAPLNGAYTKSTSAITSMSYVDDNVTAGASYQYVATAVDNAGNESTDSNLVTVTIPTP